MKVAHSIVAVLAALVLSVSFAVPAEDVLETSYDESEALPYESTPVFSSMQESARLPRLAQKLELPQQFHAGASCRVLAGRSEHTPHSVYDSATILDHSLRC